jgi:hypothetical protein
MKETTCPKNKSKALGGIQMRQTYRKQAASIVGLLLLPQWAVELFTANLTPV